MNVMKKNPILLQLGYALGTAVMLAAAVYFYASNWGALGRFEKFAPIVIAVIVLYGLSVWWGRRPDRLFLSKLSLLACCISFGIGVALIGQTYNSHADSYTLFALWLVPALLFSYLVRWQPFYILSYILGHLAYYYYFFPNVGFWTQHPEGFEIGLWAGLAVINLGLYAWTRIVKSNPSAAIRFFSFMAVHGILLALTNSHEYETYGLLFNIPVVVLFGLSVWTFNRAKDRLYLLLSGLWVSAFAVMKYFELASHYFDDEVFFILGLVFVALFIWGNVLFLNYMKKLAPPEPPEEAAVPAGSFAKDGRSAFSQWAIRVVTVSVISVGTLIGSLTLAGFLIVVAGLEEPQYVLTFLGMAVIALMLVLRRVHSVVRYTLLSIGFLLGGISTFFTDYEIVLLAVYLALAMLTFWSVNGTTQRVYFASISIILGWGLLTEMMDVDETALIIMTCLLLGVAAFSGFLIKNERVGKPILYASYPAFLLAFFILTFVLDGAAYYVCNAMFFLALTGAVLLTRKQHVSWMFVFNIGFWSAYIVYKYYDTAWKLLHKSFSLAAIGVIILLVTALAERRGRRAAGEDQEWTGNEALLLKSRAWLIAVVVVLQLAMLGAQIGRSEKLLAEGQSIKLELAPIDPRSLLQGDYVRLRFDISEPPAQWENEHDYRTKISVVLTPDTNGVYRLKSARKPGEVLQQGEVAINGRYEHSRIIYGLESYFVPEGTGLEVERTAKYAEVKVAASGDAILVRLMPE
jgi:uncharacterized membrane-anchored protein/uncharacterized membrane protein